MSSLSTNEKSQRDIYAPLYEDHGVSHKTLHWACKAHQEYGFRDFVNLIDLEGKSILDIGSGLGDFFIYLQDNGINCDFTGYEIVPSFVKVSQRRCPGARFELRNVVVDKPDRRFDYVFSNGIYAFGDSEFFEGMTKVAFELAKIAYGFTLFQEPIPEFFNCELSDIAKLGEEIGVKNIKFSQLKPPHQTFVFYHDHKSNSSRTDSRSKKTV
jgi:SAM-dependent methyltransferase